MSPGKSHFGSDAEAQRPNHPDFWALSEIALYCDALSQREDGKEAVLKHLGIDFEVLGYMAAQRALIASRQGVQGSGLFLGLFIDAFAMGIEWGKKQAQEERQQDGAIEQGG